MDWFLYDNGHRHERVKFIKTALNNASNNSNSLLLKTHIGIRNERKLCVNYVLHLCKPHADEKSL